MSSAYIDDPNASPSVVRQPIGHYQDDVMACRHKTPALLVEYPDVIPRMSGSQMCNTHQE
jgi:hypothetical protein